MNMKIFGVAIPVIAMLTSCSSQKTTTITISQQQAVEQNEITPVKADLGMMDSRPRNAVLKASAFRMSGDYANHVAVTLDASGNLTYFPGPGDISESSRPKQIGDGWWLNRQGLGPNSVFTKWTFEEYSKLPSVPSPAEIKAAIIPGAKVTEWRQLPITASEADMMPAADLLKML